MAALDLTSYRSRENILLDLRQANEVAGQTFPTFTPFSHHTPFDCLKRFLGQGQALTHRCIRARTLGRQLPAERSFPVLVKRPRPVFRNCYDESSVIVKVSAPQAARFEHEAV